MFVAIKKNVTLSYVLGSEGGISWGYLFPRRIIAKTIGKSEKK